MSKARDLANAGTALGAVTATELGYVDGVTSAIQTQLNAKQAVVSGVNDTEIGYLDGVTSAIQTQIDGKEATLPSQTGNSGKYLTTDGSTKSWGTVSQYALPSQTGNSGKYLTTNGTAESWGTISAGSMTVLLSGSVPTGTNTFTISSIPSTYTDLRVVFFNLTRVVTPGDLVLTLNGISSATYGITTIQGTTVSSGGGNTAITIGGNIIQTSALGAMGIANFYHYANTSVCKSYAVQSFQPNSGTSTRYGGLNTFSAIDSITCFSPSHNYTGGTYIVYGIK